MLWKRCDFLKHVLRTRTLKYIAEDTKPISSSYGEKKENPIFIPSDSIDFRLEADSVLFVTETFRWYEKGYRYPVFEAVRSWEQYRDGRENLFLNTAFFYPPQDHYYLDEDEANLAILENEEEDAGVSDSWVGLSYNFYPNPVVSQLEVEMYLLKSTNLRFQLRDVMGGIMLDQNKGVQQEGMRYFQVDMGGMPRGNYILDIWLGDYLVKGIVIKQ